MNPGQTTQTIANYQLLDRWEGSEWGTNYIARRMEQPQEDKEYVVKILPQKYQRQHHLLRKEGKILQRLSHRVLAQFVETGVCSKGEFKGYPYVVSQHIPGETLAAYLKKNVLSPHTAMRWAYELCEGLEYLHSQPVVHRSLNPGNIIVSWHERYGRIVRIMDAGIAVCCQPSQESNGLLPYFSPEQLSDRRVSMQADIYAMGLILYELFTGVYPYEPPQNHDAKEWRKVHNKMKPARFQIPGIPDTISDLVQSCLSKKPSKRPTAAKLVEMLQKEVSGIGQPSYIGILGHRGSGKTCYLTSLYHVSDASAETCDILEEKHTELYLKGQLPSATALSSYRLNFKINTSDKIYDIVTKDYGGELLEGRREERLNIEEAIDKDLLKEKRNEVYEFFQNARAMMIMVETKPLKKDLKAQINYRNEIYSLISLISQIKEGKRSISMPVALVLTKWDRMANISSNDALEEKRAIRYIAQTDWICDLYEKLNILCSHLKVFPVYAFLGDKPAPGNLQGFNIPAPVLWAADQSEEALLYQAKQMSASDEYDVSDKLAFHWRLLHIENITSQRVRSEILADMQVLSKKLLDEVNSKVAANTKELPWVIGQYNQFLKTRGIQSPEEEEARTLLYRYQARLKKKRSQKIKAMFVALLLLVYGLWEAWGYYSIERAILNFQESKIQTVDLLSQVSYYQKWNVISILRYFLSPHINQKIRQLVKQHYMRWIEKHLEDAPKIQENIALGRGNLPIIRIELEKSRKELEGYKLQQQKLIELQKIRQRWSKEFGLSLIQEIKDQALEDKLQSIKECQNGWASYIKYFKEIESIFEQGTKLSESQNRLLKEKQNLQKRLHTVEEKQFELSQVKELLSLIDQHKGSWKGLSAEASAYIKNYPKSPFQNDVKRLLTEIEKELVGWSEPVKKLEELDHFYVIYLGLEKFRDKEILLMIPYESDSLQIIQKKKNDLDNIRLQCKKIETAIQEKKIPPANASKYSFLSRQCLNLIEKQEQRCRYCLMRDELDSLVQKIDTQIQSDNIPHRLLMLEMKLKRIADWQKNLQEWQIPEQQLLAGDYQNLVNKKKQALRGLSIYNVCGELEKFYRNKEILSVSPIDSDSRASIQEKQSNISRRMEQCLQIEEAIATKRIPQQQSSPYSDLCKVCRTLLEEQQKRCHYFFAQDDLNRLSQQVQIEAQAANIGLSLDKRLERILNLLSQLEEWKPDSSNLLKEDYNKVIVNRDQIAKSFVIYKICQDLEKFYRNNGISQLKPMLYDSVSRIEEKQKTLQSRYRQCKEIEKAIADKQIPLQQAETYRTLYQQCQNLLGEQEKRCVFFLRYKNLEEIEGACKKVNIFKSDTPDTLKNKLEELEKQLEKLKEIQLTGLLNNDNVEAGSKKNQIYGYISEQKEKINQTLKLLESLEKKCQYWLQVLELMKKIENN
mgnify:CR=1 FL=1